MDSIISRVNKEVRLLMSKDGRLIQDCVENAEENTKKFDSIIKSTNKDLETVHPLDNEIVEMLKKLSSKSSDEFFLFHELERVEELWNLLIEKSIICLRFFDTREPFLDFPAKHPSAYGIKDLRNYFKKYIKFEEVLYGGAKYYRDHIVHVVRVWLLGVNALLTNNCQYLNSIQIADGFKVNELEKISIWTLIALTHDLGYPLEKAQSIIESTRKMMKCFVADPNISIDLSFNGVQNNMNDFVLRFMSSKMIPKNNGCALKEKCELLKEKDSSVYVTRLQSKYYFKFQKSLENYKHGTISTIIIYKLLLFFLESDFTINEDYEFKYEDARQFYIRREILRSIASHTCSDIYHLKISSFAILLIIADDSQEWGRKSISELYAVKRIDQNLDSINFILDDENDKIVDVNEKYVLGEAPIDLELLTRILRNQYNQFCHYTALFRDGQDTKNRDFSYKKTCEITLTDSVEIVYKINFTVANKEQSSFEVIMQCSKLKDKFDTYGREFLKKVFTSKGTNKVYLKDGADNLESRTKAINFQFITPKPDDRIE